MQCPRCHDDVQDNAYAIHVSKTCIAIGKSPEEVKAIQEANDEPCNVVESLLQDLSYADIDPTLMSDSVDGDY